MLRKGIEESFNNNCSRPHRRPFHRDNGRRLLDDPSESPARQWRTDQTPGLFGLSSSSAFSAHTGVEDSTTSAVRSFCWKFHVQQIQKRGRQMQNRVEICMRSFKILVIRYLQMAMVFAGLVRRRKKAVKTCANRLKSVKICANRSKSVQFCALLRAAAHLRGRGFSTVAARRGLPGTSRHSARRETLGRTTVDQIRENRGQTPIPKAESNSVPDFRWPLRSTAYAVISRAPRVPSCPGWR